MQNCIDEDQRAETLTSRGSFGATNLFLLLISSDSHFTVETSVVSNIILDEPAGLKRKIHGKDVKHINTEEDLFVAHAGLIIVDHEILPYPYNSKTDDDVHATLEDLLASNMYVWDSIG